MEKNSKNQKEELARRLAEEEEKEDERLTINQRAYKFNFNSDKPRITYAKQRIVFI